MRQRRGQPQFLTGAIAALMLFSGLAAAESAQPVTHMSDELRDTISRIVILCR